MISEVRKQKLILALKSSELYLQELGFEKEDGIKENDDWSQKFTCSKYELHLTLIVLSMTDFKKSTVGFVIGKQNETDRLILALLLEQRGIDLKIKLDWSVSDEQWDKDCALVGHNILQCLKDQVHDVLTGQKWYTTPFDWRSSN